MRFFSRGKPRQGDEPSEAGPAAGPPGQNPITAQAEAFVGIMADMAPGLQLDYSPASLNGLDGFISATFETPESGPAPDSFQADVGAYVGEVIRRSLGGTWAADGSLHDVGGEISQIHPHSKARKRFANGTHDSLAWFYEVVSRHARPR